MLGGKDTGNKEAKYLLRIVAQELSAESLVCVAPQESASTKTMMGALLDFGDELTHNHHLDIALQLAFGQNAIAFLNRDLLRLSRLLYTVDHLTERLRILREHVSLGVSDESLGHLVTDPDIIRSLEPVSPSDMPQRPWGGIPSSAIARSVSPRLLAKHIDASRESYRSLSESDEATSLTEVTNQLEAREAGQAVDRPETRSIQHVFWRKQDGRFVEEGRRLVVGVLVMLQVRRGPPDVEWQSAPEGGGVTA